MTRTGKRFLYILLAAAGGGIVGGTLAGYSHLHARNLSGILHFSRGMTLAVVLIALFSIYWDTAAKSSAPAQSSESRSSRGLHLAVLNGSVFLLILSVPGLTHKFLPQSAALTVIGLAVEIGGIGFAVWARRHLGTNWSGEVRIAAGHQLIRSGPYAHLRHPIYTGVLAMYLGAALVSGQVHALIAMLLITLAYLRKIGLEEKLLAANFGAAWDLWRNESWALVPLLY